MGYTVYNKQDSSSAESGLSLEEAATRFLTQDGCKFRIRKFNLSPVGEEFRFELQVTRGPYHKDYRPIMELTVYAPSEQEAWDKMVKLLEAYSLTQEHSLSIVSDEAFMELVASES